MKKYRLKIFDKKTTIKNEYNFILQLLRNSTKILLISILLIGVLIGLDYLGLFIYNTLSSSNILWTNKISSVLYKINNLWGEKYIDYFKDVIVIVSGVLGVILALFFTTFINIISSKYAHVNTVVTHQILNQKVINKYFRLLTILVVSAIIFQFLLFRGYVPTLISSLLFTLFILVAIIAFVFYGKYSMIYFDAAYLVSDVIMSSIDTINRVTINRKYICHDSTAKYSLFKIRNNNNTIKTIIQESTQPQLGNTSFNNVSKELLQFAIEYSRIKSIFPSNKDWFPTYYRHKKRDEVSNVEMEMYNKSGYSLPQEKIIDYTAIEKQLIDIQFLIFDQDKTELIDKITLISEQYKYLQVISFQCELDIFKSYFNHLEKFIFTKLSNRLDQNSSVYLVSLYTNHLIQYLVGFNHNFSRIITTEELKKLATRIHTSKDLISAPSIPYQIKKWIDDYQEKLAKEVYYEGKIITPLFHTEYEIANNIQYVFQNHIKEVLEDIFNRVISFGNTLKNNKYYLETVEFLYESLDLVSKSSLFTEIVDKRITELNTLNLKKEITFSFEDRDEILSKSKQFNNNIISEIWDLGIHCYPAIKMDLPDMFGTIYNLLCRDIVTKAFENRDNFIKYFSKFLVYNIFYIEELRKNINTKNIEHQSAKVFPLIVDLFDICSITIILFKLHEDKELQNIFFDNLNQLFQNETQENGFWKIAISIYQHFNQPLFMMSTNSYIREHERKQLLSKYLQNSELIRLEQIDIKFTFAQEYKTDIDDVFLKLLLKKITPNRGFEIFNLSEIFIEYYLRTKITLKDINIKETRYGKNIAWHMDKDS